MSAREYPDRPWVGVGVVLFRGDDVLLIRRGRPPNAGVWSIPGGTQELDETVEDAARRELREETGLTPGPLTFAAAVDIITRDAEGRVRFHYTILDYAARWAGGDPAAGDDADDARFFTPAELAALPLWSETRRVIAEARRCLDQ
ncbi:NUDIX hydrolase [Roseomonas sp. CCTCC AB2023176]|uniref:NUDIX hydrolase n=1 Tax=Roseomonas sp. CCTCC AB2023176 TaxID=3342640 RepID=UPI0035D5366B